MINNKILNENELKKKIHDLKKKNKTISHCHGVFDLLHIGHIKHFEEAKSLSDILIVSITADKLVNKGPGRPYFSQKSRLHAIASLQAVNFVCLSQNISSTKVTIPVDARVKTSATEALPIVPPSLISRSSASVNI